MTLLWDPEIYLHHADDRARPFWDLMARVPVATPAEVVDLGCGPGTLTKGLADRWQSARVIGVDSSAEMVERARTHAMPGRCEFVVGDVRDWRPDGPVDVLVSNATLQWVPGHLDLLPSWVETLAPGGCLAIQVPANFDAPSHVQMRELAATPRWRDALAGVLRDGEASPDPAAYFEVLAAAGCSVDAWQTTYLHVLAGDDAVLGWVRGTALRPVLSALSAGDAEEFVAAYAARLRVDYPRGPHGTVFPFRRTFVVARRGTGGRTPTTTIDGTSQDRRERAAAGSRQRSAAATAATTIDAVAYGLHHCQLACPAGAEDQLRAFYTGVLGMAEVTKPPVLAARGGVWFRSGSAELHLGVEEPFRPARKAHPGLLVDDIDATAARLTAAEAAVLWDPHFPGHRRLYTADPSGTASSCCSRSRPRLAASGAPAQLQQLRRDKRCHVGRDSNGSASLAPSATSLAPSVTQRSNAGPEVRPVRSAHSWVMSISSRPTRVQ